MPKLTPKQEAWLVRHYKHTKNAEIAERLGVSPRTVNRLANLYGLKKSAQFIRKTQTDAAAAAKLSHLRHGTYPPKGYIIPRSAEFQFRAGETPAARMGEKRWKEAHARAVESRKKTWRHEHARWIFGVERKTKLRVAQQPKQRILDRHYLKKRGYIIDDPNCIAYWTADTQRATRLEARPRRYYIFKQHPEL